MLITFRSSSSLLRQQFIRLVTPISSSLQLSNRSRQTLAWVLICENLKETLIKWGYFTFCKLIRHARKYLGKFQAACWRFVVRLKITKSFFVPEKLIQLIKAIGIKSSRQTLMYFIGIHSWVLNSSTRRNVLGMGWRFLVLDLKWIDFGKIERL